MSPNSSKCHKQVWIQAGCPAEAQGRFRFVLAALLWAGELTFLLGFTSHWHYPLVLQGPACPVPTSFLLEGGITGVLWRGLRSWADDYPCGASPFSFSSAEQEMEVARAVLTPGMLSRLAWDDNNAISENRIKILKGAQCLKGNDFFKWIVIICSYSSLFPWLLWACMLTMHT